MSIFGKKKRKRFEGGAPGTSGYPFQPGHPMYGNYLTPGYYGDDGTRYDTDTDGDGVSDSQDAAPHDASAQTAGDVSEQSGPDPDGGFDDGPGGQGTQYESAAASTSSDSGSSYSSSDSGSSYSSSDSGSSGGGGDSGGGGGGGGGE